MNANNYIEDSQSKLQEVEGFTDLENDKLISTFMMIWALVEKDCLEKNAGEKKITKFTEGIADSNPTVDEAFKYFYARYFIDAFADNRLGELCPNAHSKGIKNKLTKIAGKLVSSQHEHNAEVNEPLIENIEPSSEEKAEFTLLVVYRLRNNLFHGEKFEGLNDQRDNLEHAIKVCLWALSESEN